MKIRQFGIGSVAIALSWAAATAAAPTQEPLGPPEEAVESLSNFVRLPASANGILIVRSCADCPAVQLVTDANTKYLVGISETTLDRFAKRIAADANVGVTAYYVAKEKRLTRLVITSRNSAR